MPYQDCDSSDDCYIGQYCGFKAGRRFCLECLNCRADFNRENSTALGACAQSHHDCGHCLPEFSDLPPAGGVRLEACTANDSSNPVNDVIKHLEEHGGTWVTVLKIGGALLGIIAGGFTVWAAYRKCLGEDAGEFGDLF